ncbi:MAG: sel1 repeat family protein [Methylocystaceae bacterium]|nr:sel1 repeat family protein [Methylocystaceae bacterium]
MRYLLSLFCFCLFLGISSAYASSARDLAEKLQTQAENGDLSAAYKLGLLWSQGKKVAPDFVTAAEWFERAAQGGYTRAMLKIANMYGEGQGVPQDRQRAISWYEKAAQKRSTEAMVKLGTIFTAQEDFDTSAYWYEKAAIRGDKDALRELGSFYYKGTGVHFDLQQAFVWLELAAQKGDYAAKSLQRDIVNRKGQEWGDGLRQKVNNRMMPEKYWNAR